MQRLYVITSFLYELLKPRLIFALVLLLLVHARGIAGELPDLGKSSSAVLSAAEEYKLGRTVVKELQAAHMVFQDTIVNEYLQSLGYRLIATQSQAQRPYQFFAVNDGSINAFALPGAFYRCEYWTHFGHRI